MSYDIKPLLEKIKAKGLDLAEEAVQLVVDSVFEWLPEEAAKSETKIDDFIVSFLPLAKPAIDGIVDNIDHKVG